MTNDEQTDGDGDGESQLMEILRASPPVVCTVLRAVARVAPLIPADVAQRVADIAQAVAGVCCEHEGEQRERCINSVLDAVE